MTQEQALTILKTGANVFLTGKPGSGKTYTINQFVTYLKSHGITPAVTASTGIAATHIGGSTIHSWSGIGISNFLDKYNLDRIASSKYIIKRVDPAKVLIIDEVSMLSPQTLTMVDQVCREVKRNQQPFGGLQVIFVGDFFQLPPINKAPGAGPIFAYESDSWTEANPVICYLTEQHRQTDHDFNILLNAIREGDVNGEHIAYLEKRIVSAEAQVDAPKLFSHNLDVDRVNEIELKKLPGEQKTFMMTSRGRSSIVEALMKSCLSPEQLNLKINAAVMFTKNNPKEGYVNGTLGKIIGFEKDSGYPVVKTHNNRTITVSPVDWSIMEGDRILGMISQFPLRLAWAITVHKSQGMTLDAAVMDLRQVFEFGQGYVALSRVRTLSGLHLLGWNDRTFQVHPQILEIDQKFLANSWEAEQMFGKIPAEELDQMQKNFIIALDGTLEEIDVPEVRLEPKVKIDTYVQTLTLWNEGKTLAEIVTARELTEETILSHIEKLVRQEKISASDANRLVTKKLKELLPTIHAAFDELGTEKLSPVFSKFNGQHSFNDLRIARMLYKKQ